MKIKIICEIDGCYPHQHQHIKYKELKNKNYNSACTWLVDNTKFNIATLRNAALYYNNSFIDVKKLYDFQIFYLLYIFEKHNIKEGEEDETWFIIFDAAYAVSDAFNFFEENSIPFRLRQIGCPRVTYKKSCLNCNCNDCPIPDSEYCYALDKRAMELCKMKKILEGDYCLKCEKEIETNLKAFENINKDANISCSEFNFMHMCFKIFIHDDKKNISKIKAFILLYPFLIKNTNENFIDDYYESLISCGDHNNKILTDKQVEGIKKNFNEVYKIKYETTDIQTWLEKLIKAINKIVPLGLKESINI